ncbi:uncharacterized protein LOC112012924 [Quercus suber]|uniref:uncharacterized protein LOC112012924 n=1 Tax=Quercus suber TaxID=58331 RepID=UPI000CE204A0|nr:uncharacterized protein LOC112012924 [Quercus suber]
MEDNANREKDFSWGKGHANHQLSFKDKLVGELPGAFPEVKRDTSGLRKGLTAIRIFDELKQKIRAPWARALIVKVYGRTVGFNFLQQKLFALWKLKGRLDYVDLNKDFYLVKFSAMDDYDLVLDKGPWFIGEHFLSIRPWFPNFKPCSTDVSSIAVWVRLNELPIEYYQVEALKEIGSTIGKVLRIDTHTALEARGCYARICVQIEVEKPLITALLIGNFEQAVIYKGIQELCFSCGRIGHRKEDCPHIIRPTPPAREEEEGVEKTQGSSRVRHDANSAEDQQSGAITIPSDRLDAESAEDNTYGPWMVVTRKRNGYKSSRYNNTTRTSRYVEERQRPTGATFHKNDTSKERLNDNNRKNGMAQSSSWPQWVKLHDKRNPIILNPNQLGASPTVMGLNPVAFNASSFSPKSLSPK